MAAIKYPPFVRRLNLYLNESEEYPMEFKNEKHRELFGEAIRRKDKKDYALMAALYLLTADFPTVEYSQALHGESNHRF